MKYLILIILYFAQYFDVVHAQHNLKVQELNAIDQIENDSMALQHLVQLARKNGSEISLLLEINRRIIIRTDDLKKFDRSIALANESANMAKRNGLDSMEALFYKLLGISNYCMDRKRAAIPYFEKCMAIAKENNLWELEANCNNNIGGCYTDLQEYMLAEPYLLRCIAMMETQGKGITPIALRTLRVLARMYSESGKPEKAEPLYLSLIEKAKNLKDTALLGNSLLFYSEDLSQRGETKKAVEMSGEAMGYLRKQNDPQTLLAGFTIHAVNLSRNGQFEEAYKLIQESNSLMRKTFASNLENAISESEVRYNTARIRQEKEIAEVSAKKQKQFYLAAFLCTLIVAGASGYGLVQRKNSRQATKHLQELAVIEKLRFKEVIEAEEKERSRIARELHDGLGQMLSTARLHIAGLEDAINAEDKASYDISLNTIDTACIEVRSISHNLMPNALIRLGLIPAIQELVHAINSAKGIKIDFESEIEGSLGISLDITIYRVVQEILNNMIKHAQASKIYLSIEKNVSELTILIHDNGIGFDTEQLKNTAGIGWKNIFSRISMINGNINLQSELQKGTRVYISLKLKDE